MSQLTPVGGILGWPTKYLLLLVGTEKLGGDVLEMEMSRKLYTPEQFIGKLRESEVALALAGSRVSIYTSTPEPRGCGAF